MLKVKTVPSSFSKTFVCDYVEDIDERINTYAENNELEIISISICYTDFYVATVVFERGMNNAE